MKYEWFCPDCKQRGEREVWGGKGRHVITLCLREHQKVAPHPCRGFPFKVKEVG